MDDSLDNCSSCPRFSPVTRRRLLQTGGGITATSVIGSAGCVGDSRSPENSDDSHPSGETEDEIPVEIVALLDQRWQARQEDDPETYRDLHHPNSPKRDERWDERYWEELFHMEQEIEVEDRELVEKTETEATVREIFLVFRDPDHPPSRPTLVTYEIKREDDEWLIWDQTSEQYFEWMGNGDEYAPEDFTQCRRLIVSMDRLPEYVRNEVRTALEEGVYEAEELYITHLMDVEESYLRQAQQDTFYRAHVTEVSGGYQLELEEATPSHGVSVFELRNRTETEQTVTLRIERESPDFDVDEMETIFEGTDTISTDGVIEIVEFDRYFVQYRIEVETDDASYTHEWTERETNRSIGGVSITDEEILPEPRPQLEPINCRGVWEDAITSD